MLRHAILLLSSALLFFADGGAVVAATKEATLRTSEHWAFVSPVLHELPPVKNCRWVRNEIDSFVLAKLEKEGMEPSPESDRRTLARRLSLDLIGLSPSPEQVRQFVEDHSPDAYERPTRSPIKRSR